MHYSVSAEGEGIGPSWDNVAYAPTHLCTTIGDGRGSSYRHRRCAASQGHISRQTVPPSRSHLPHE